MTDIVYPPKPIIPNHLDTRGCPICGAGVRYDGRDRNYACCNGSNSYDSWYQPNHLNITLTPFAEITKVSLSYNDYKFVCYRNYDGSITTYLKKTTWYKKDNGYKRKLETLYQSKIMPIDDIYDLDELKDLIRTCEVFG